MDNPENEADIRASVVIPTFNGDEYLDEVLGSVFSQEADFGYEVIVIDSGSSDNTLAIVSKYPANLLRIGPEEFNHGGTRNLGVETARGEFVAFLTQDATPADPGWLGNLVACFDMDDRIAAVFGRHLPRDKCDPITRRDIEGMFDSLSVNSEPVVQFLGDEEGRIAYAENEGLFRFYSDVNSCLRKSIWREVPYQEVAYAEDQVYGRDIIEKGYMKVYCPKAAVYHSHSYPIRKMVKRFYDEFKGLNVVFGYKDANLNLFNMVPASLTAAVRDMTYINKQDFTKLEEVYWCWYAFWWHLLRRVAIYLGGRHDKLPKAVSDLLSLEHQTKRKPK